MAGIYSFLKRFSAASIFIFIGLMLTSLLVYKVSGLMRSILFILVSIAVYVCYIFRDFIEWGKSQIYEWSLTIFLLILACYMGIALANEEFWPIYFVIGIIYSILLFRKPEVVFLIASVLILNMFHLINPDFMSIKGIFKLRDVLLVAPFLPLVVKETIRRKNISFIYGSISAKAIIGMCLMVLFFMLLTVLRYSYSFLLSFKIGRDYFYYLFFFAVVYSIQSKKQLDFILKWMLILSIIFSVLYSLHAVSGGAINLFPAYIGGRGHIWGLSLARGYVSFGFAGMVLFALIGVVAFINSEKIKLWLMVFAVFLSVAYFLSLGRSGWYSGLLTIVVIVLLLPADRKYGFMKWLLKGVGIFTVTMLLLGFIRYGSSMALLSGGASRFKSGFTEISNSSGSFGVRARVFNLFTENLTKENLVFGIGFLYPDTDESSTLPIKTVIYSDSGLVTLLNTMGVLGCLIYVIINIIFIVRGFYIFHRLKHPIYRGFLISFLAGWLVNWVVVFTYSALTHYFDITLTAIYLGLNEVMYKIDSEELSAKNGTLGNNTESQWQKVA